MRPALLVRLWCWNGWSDKWFAASSKARQSICVVCGTFQGPSPAHGNLADCSKRCKSFVGDDACIVPHGGLCVIFHSAIWYETAGAHCAPLRVGCMFIVSPSTAYNKLFHVTFLSGAPPMLHPGLRLIFLLLLLLFPLFFKTFSLNC